MAAKKIYIHFEGSNYIFGKSEALKVQMDILNLKKVLKSLSLTREQKVHYQQMLEETFQDLKKHVSKLDDLMPDDGVHEIHLASSKPIKTKPKKKIEDSSKLKDVNNGKNKQDNIEEELIRIKQKLSSLNFS